MDLSAATNLPRRVGNPIPGQARLDALPGWHRVSEPNRRGALSVAEVGLRMQRTLLAGLPIDHLVLDRVRRVAWMSTTPAAEPDLPTAMAMVVSNLRDISDWRDQTFSKMSRTLARMSLHLEHQGVECVADIDVAVLEAWIHSGVKWHGAVREPSLSTRHFRLSVARFFFRSLQFLQVPLVDASRLVVLPERQATTTRPLTDDEEVLCRLVTQHTLVESRRPVAWALGQATATTGEQSAVLVGDVDLDAGQVWLAGNGKRTPRWGYLTPWGRSVIESSIKADDRPDRGLVYPAQTSVESGSASVCKAVSEVLSDAGFGPDKAVRPLSLVAWAGRRILDENGRRVDIVARRLGISDLNRAAALIDWDWANEPD